MNDADVARMKRAKDLASSGSYAEAMEILDKLVAEQPEEAKAWAARAHVSGRERKLEAAIRDWSEAIRFMDKEPHYFYMRGIDLLSAAKYAEALADFSTVIELCDYHRSDYYREPAHFFRAETYLRLKDFARARADCEHVSDEMQTWVNGHRCKADILAECDPPAPQ
jgi:tetratricopeptide (TPR) repeat protein